MNTQFRHHQRGFTLIEIMMALALFALVVSAIYSVWMGVTRGAKIGLAAAAQAQRQRMSMRILEEALSCVQSFQGSVDYYGFVAKNGSDAEISFVAKLPDSFPRSGRFYPLNVRRVTFSLEQGDGYEKHLVLRQQPIISEMDRDEEENPMLLARNVKELEFKFFDERTKGWVDDWPETNQIPQLMLVTLTLGQPGRYRTDWRSEVEINKLITPVTIAVPVSWQVPQRGGAARPGVSPIVPPGGIAR